MHTLATTFTSAALALVLAVPAVAQDDADELALALERAAAAATSELALLEERLSSDDWMVFESASRGLVQIHLPEVARIAPLVRELRADGSMADLGAVADRVPGLWQAWTLFADAPDDVLDATPDEVAAWARDRFAHLQSSEQRARLLADQQVETGQLVAGLALAGERLADESPMTESPMPEDLAAESPMPEDLAAESPMPEDLAAESPMPESPMTEDLAAEPVRCGEDVLDWSTDPGALHDRFSGVWEYYGTPGLTLNRVGDFVCATYGRGDGWMKLAIIDEHTLRGRWYEGEHLASCAEQRAGTYHWGWLEMRFDEDFDDYVGELAVCDGSPVDRISGAKSW